MEQLNFTTGKAKHKHFTERQRYKLEGHLEAKLSIKEISKKLKKHPATIYRETKRGQVTKISSDLTEYTVYRANVAQRNYKTKVINRKHSLKIEKDKALEKHIRKKILEEKYSPDAVIGEIKQKKLPFKTRICTKTLYNYIEDGILAGITNLALWEKRKRKKKRHKKVQRISLKNKGAKGIEERPKEANQRSKYGHWEGDSVKGPKKKGKEGLFTLTERMTREEIVIKLKSGQQSQIQKALDNLEIRYGRQFNSKFKTITFDNGSEFLNWKSMEQSILSIGKKRTEVYFAHPYTAWERGS
ncbi:MAG: IS30 family transposase, partial [Candidatus Omnitrophica bacterium]|nr:IS30 family transposase [Candidatus Omnitrophota bacterium]